MLYSQALLAATYVNGTPGKLTPEHERAEKHPFKLQRLFKDKIIPKDLYVSRLIQHLLIIEGIENQLKDFSEGEMSEISAFFALAYLEQLWRTPGIKNDLCQLMDAKEIKNNQVAQTTASYQQLLKTLTPKELLAHYLFHLVGFMHGGALLRTKYIDASNQLTDYQIPSEQYDFSAAVALTPGKGSALAVYRDMMSQIDAITLSEEEYNDIVEQGKKVYETMASIYDDLWVMHSTPSPRQSPWSTMAIMGVGLMVASFVLKLLCDLYPAENTVSNRI